MRNVAKADPVCLFSVPFEDGCVWPATQFKELQLHSA